VALWCRFSPSVGKRESSAELSVVARGATIFLVWRRPVQCSLEH
jgi:hypothetical protein